ncbi:hypothetical protein DL505_11470 [Providencia stuartii]|nr:hypothetical protein DL505_11470 [Providencia stuartii]
MIILYANLIINLKVQGGYMEYEHNKGGKPYSKLILIEPIVWIFKKLTNPIKAIYYHFKTRKKFEKYKNQKI